MRPLLACSLALGCAASQLAPSSAPPPPVRRCCEPLGDYLRGRAFRRFAARVKARGHAVLEEKQLKVHFERYGNIAHLWSSYALRSDGKQVARAINSIQAIKEAGGWRVTGIMVQAESVTAPPPKE